MGVSAVLIPHEVSPVGERVQTLFPTNDQVWALTPRGAGRGARERIRAREARRGGTVASETESTFKAIGSQKWQRQTTLKPAAVEIFRRQSNKDEGQSQAKIPTAAGGGMSARARAAARDTPRDSDATSGLTRTLPA